MDGGCKANAGNFSQSRAGPTGIRTDIRRNSRAENAQFSRKLDKVSLSTPFAWCSGVALHVRSFMGLTTQTYDILSRIAIGNGSLVYRAVDKTTLRVVALKLLSQDDEITHRSDVPALLAAAPQLKQISGNHVCQLLDAYDDEEGPVLVYEFINGLNGAELPQQRRLDAAQALDIAGQIISALRSGERQRLPHGDLKPSNLVCVDMPDGRPFVMVLDWGLAAFRTEQTMDSFPYLAPERLAGAPASHQADLFAAGAVLFYLLTGKVLANGADRNELMVGWSNARPEVLVELRPDLSPKLVHWICGLLALDPQKRPKSAVEAGTALAMLNPPPPMAAPESIRPRPASQRPAAGVPVSGISAPPSAIAPRPVASAVRPAPSAAGVPVPQVMQPRQPTAVPPAKKKSNVALFIVLSILAPVATFGTAWWVVRGKKDSDHRPGPGTSASRTPAPSVTAPVAKPQPRGLPEKSLAGPSQDDSKSDAAKAKAAARALRKAAAVTGAPYGGSTLPLEKIFIATESFEYPEDVKLDSQSAGTGWAAAWKGTKAQIEDTSLSYPSHPSQGGSLRIAAVEEDVQWERPIGPLKNFLRDPNKGGHWYFTAIVQQTNEKPGTGGELRLIPFDSADAKQPVQIVVRNVEKGLNITMPGAPAPVELPDASQPVFLLCRISFLNPKEGKWDVTAMLLVNPKIASPTFAGGGKPIVSTQPSVEVPPQMAVQIRRARGESITQIDEIRYGRHWEEMTFKTPQIDPPLADATGR
jgi:serine/threonine protein kinase